VHRRPAIIINIIIIIIIIVIVIIIIIIISISSHHHHTPTFAPTRLSLYVRFSYSITQHRCSFA
jgi:amino acid transporter